MNIAFRETPAFSNVCEEYFGGDEGYRAFQNALMEQPEKGNLIQGTGGLRKIRWIDPRRGKGKRGGLRIIYFYDNAAAMIYLMAVYNKNIPDLTPAQRRLLAASVNEIKATR